MGLSFFFNHSQLTSSIIIKNVSIKKLSLTLLKIKITTQPLTHENWRVTIQENEYFFLL